jgi:hypothetical protein
MRRPDGLLLSKHGALLLEIYRDGDATVQQLARRLHIDPRTAQRLITDLDHAGVLTRRREGNRNRYLIHADNEADAALPGVTSGRIGVQHEDGTELELGPGDAYIIEPGHDAWVVGGERFVGFEFESKSAEEYAKS